MEKNILISVVIPVYNSESYINYAINSILNQTYQYFELIIINDGSTDNSVAIIESFKDDRIKIINNKNNRGVAIVGNQGISKAKGKYIARLDADDIAHPKRLETQLQFLEKHTDVVILGSQAQILNTNKMLKQQLKVPIQSSILPIYSLFYCPFIQPSVMVRTDIIKEFYYDNHFVSAEDYELWTRILKKYKGSNLSESLIQYRIHNTNFSNVQKEKQVESVRKIYQHNLEYIGMSYSQEDLETFLKVSGSYDRQLTIDEIRKIKVWLVKMQNHLLSQSKFENNQIREVFSTVWFQIFRKSNQLGVKGLLMYFFQSDFKSNPATKNLILIGKYILSIHHLVLRLFKKS